MTNSRYTHLTQVELEAEEAALTAALEAVRGKVKRNWFAITTAPVEVPVLLGGWDTDRYSQRPRLRWVEYPGMAFERNARGYRFRSAPSWVTHWMPLPPPPPSTILEGDA